MPRCPGAPSIALALILTITAAWWALALWPLPESTPAWLEQARLVCFGSSRHTLPTAQGWLLLIGEPLAMLGILYAIWPEAMRRQARRVAIGSVGLGLLTLVVTAAARARTGGEAFDPAAGALAERLGRAAPSLQLTDQHGQAVTLADFAGRPVLVAFAYAHCTTVCPVVVHDALEAQRRVPGVELLVITLDPWRDTPVRLPSIAQAWGFGEGTHLLSGDTTLVQRTLDQWEVPRWRDTRTGEVTHPTFVYLVDRAGRLAWRSPSTVEALSNLLRTM